MDIELFIKTVKQFYNQYKRDFAWRHEPDPYKIVVSEIMLQQTQTSRVLIKYPEFITVFPTIFDLASASTAQVLHAWNGLGYNRRGIFLHKLAQEVVAKYGGIVPETEAALIQLPGIGPGTAGSIVAFAFNKPSVFIETNIRSVFLHSFFPNQTNISDVQVMPLIEQTLDYTNPREWYYALMDYGVFLKQQFLNPSRKSKHHTKQSKFEGSNRQLRGAILRKLLVESKLTITQLLECLDGNDVSIERLESILQKMAKEGLIRINDDVCQLL